MESRPSTPIGKQKLKAIASVIVIVLRMRA